jgi:FixJ family two-component response regulator
LNKQAAAWLGISEVTLRVHRGQVMRKMAADSFAELVRMAGKLGLPASGADTIETYNRPTGREHVRSKVALQVREPMRPHQLLIGVVDDDPRIRESFKELLASGGYAVLPFPSAEAFLDSNGFQQVDCLISDIGMPAITGWELLRMARTDHPGLPVILITAEDQNDPLRLLEAKAARYVFRKPFDGRELLAALDAILRNS